MDSNPLATSYEHWNDGRQRNHGSFQTSLFKAYQNADATNRAKLEAAYPEWFVEKFKLY